LKSYGRQALLFFILFLATFSVFAGDSQDYNLAVTRAALHVLGQSPQPLQLLKGTYVNMVVFTTFSGYKLTDKALTGTIWVTVEPEIKKLCAEYVAKNKAYLTTHQLNIWIAQLLGVSANKVDKRRFVVLRIPVIQAYYGTPAKDIGIFRPCADPRIGPHADGSPICPERMNPHAAIAADYKTWFINTSMAAYTLNGGMPWTAYGYTYNWNPQASQAYGISEFVILKNTPVRVLANPFNATTAYISAAQYCS